MKRGRIGLVLSGGGARGAYQAGVISAIGQISAELKLPRPVPVLTGASAGAINATYLASQSDRFSEACENLAYMWSELTTDQVFKTDAVNAGFLGLKLLSDVTLGALYRRKLARSLLNTQPLNELILKRIDFARLERNIAHKHIDALAITAMSYSGGSSTTFVHGDESFEMWTRSRRRSVRVPISDAHVMASSAIPLFFPPVQIDEQHYGDGCLRNHAPLSPAIHLKADRLIVIGVRCPVEVESAPSPAVEPSLARVLGVIMNALFLDAVDIDMERMVRINTTVSAVPLNKQNHLGLRSIEALWLRPSIDIGQLAGDLFHKLPNVIRYLVGGLGSSREASELTSYLLFDPEFCTRLVDRGRADGFAQRDLIAEFLTREV